LLNHTIAQKFGLSYPFNVTLRYLRSRKHVGQIIRQAKRTLLSIHTAMASSMTARLNFPGKSIGVRTSTDTPNISSNSI